MNWLTATRPLIIGHRGASADAPENTLAAFALALEQGADGIEFDVRLCADGVPVVIHDDTVDRTSDGTGRVIDLTLDELKQLAIDQTHAIPMLDDVFETFGRAPLYNVELKAGGGVGDNGLAAAVVARIAAHRLGDRVLVSSFNPFVLRRARRLLPTTVPVGLLRERAWLRAGHALVRAQADHPDHTLVDEALMGWARDRNLRINVWTVDDPAEAQRMTRLGVHAIITNKPSLIRKACSAANPD
ncbi:MAG: glycerophosphodiester phosphodiesterase family protein [Chloroflexota bacterium]|jgi:glycerophosphoryl diester phosphodiesterase